MFRKESPAMLQCVAVAIAMLAIVLSGCGPTPPPPSVALVVNPDITEVFTGQTVTLIAETSGKDLRFKWSAARGKLSTFDEAAVFYTAPDSAGVDTVTVEVRSSSGTTIKHVSFNVMVPDTPTPIATPMNTPTYPPTVTPTPTATPTNTPTPTPTRAIPDAVVVAPVNLRSGPGTEYAPPIAILSLGQILTVTGRNAEATWLQVITDQMQEGWIVNRADLVTLNLATEQILIVSPPPPPTEPLMSFQNFELDNGTPGDYCRGVWFASCSFESIIVCEGSRAVRVDTHAEAQGSPGDHGGTIGINPSSSDPIDLSSVTTLSVWVYDTLGDNTLQLRLRDNNDALSDGVWSEMHTEQNNWTEIIWSLSDFTGVDLSQIKNIELYEWWDGVYYFDAVSWQIAMPTPTPKPPPIAAPTPIPTAAPPPTPAPPPTEAPKPTPTAPPPPAPMCQITEPADGDESLGYDNEVRVTCSDVPDSMYIWILVYSHHDFRYYPQPGPIGSGSGQRRGVAYLGTPTEGIGHRFDIIVALADEAVSVKLLQDAESYSGYEFTLPDGVEEKDRITVRRGH